MLWKISVTILTFLGLVLTVSNINFYDIISRFKSIKKKINRERNNFHYTTYTSIGYKLDKLERIIQRSNIRIYIPYSIWTHLFISFIFFILGSIWMEKYMHFVVSMFFGLGMSMVPLLLLRIITDIVSFKIKRTSVDFLIILKNFFVSGKNTDIFESFRKASEYISEPLKTYVKTMVYERDHKVNPVQCLENFKNNIEVSDLKIFVENLKISYIHGGDIVGLIDAFIEEISDQNDDEDEENTEDTILNMGLYILLFVNFMVIYYLMNSSYKTSILEPLWGQVVIVVDILVAIYIVIQSMRKLQD